MVSHDGTCNKPLLESTRTPAFWDTPYCPTITHTSDSHQIPSQNKTKSKLQIQKDWNFARNFTCDTTHLLKLLCKMYEYEMDPTRTVGTTEWTCDAGWTDGRTDGVKPIYPPTTSLYRGYNNASVHWCIWCIYATTSLNELTEWVLQHSCHDICKILHHCDGQFKGSNSRKSFMFILISN